MRFLYSDPHHALVIQQRTAKRNKLLSQIPFSIRTVQIRSDPIRSHCAASQTGSTRRLKASHSRFLIGRSWVSGRLSRLGFSSEVMFSQRYILEYDAVQSGTNHLIFRRNLLCPSEGYDYYHDGGGMFGPNATQSA